MNKNNITEEPRTQKPAPPEENEHRPGAGFRRRMVALIVLVSLVLALLVWRLAGFQL